MVPINWTLKTRIKEKKMRSREEERGGKLTKVILIVKV